MSGKYCSVDGCSSQKRDKALAFFRCPLDEARRKIWKTRLGFIGNHRYANLNPKQSNERIKICSLHFTKDSYTNTEKPRLYYNAVPSLLLPTVTYFSGNNTEATLSEASRNNHTDACVQTDSCIQKVFTILGGGGTVLKGVSRINYVDTCVQTDWSIQEEKSVSQTVVIDKSDKMLSTGFDLSWITPYPELTVEGNTLHCKACLKTIRSDSKLKIEQHMKTTQHFSNLRKLEVGKADQKTGVEPNSTRNFEMEFNEFVVNNTEPNSNQSTSSSGGASTAQQEVSDRNTVTLIEDIKREEEYDDTFDEAADEALPVTKEELLDIVNESHLSSNQEENPEIASLKKEPIANDQEGYGEPPNKKMKSEKLPSTTTDKAGPSDELVSNDRLAQETGNHLVGTFQQDPALAGMLDSSGNIDLFFESILALAKTLSPLDQVLLQRNVANVVFGMKITQLTKNKSLSS